MIINASGGGSSSFNFTILGSASQLATAKENTIWVNTDTEIVDYYFGVGAKESPSEGTVWFPTGTRSPVAINVAKKNDIWIYPTGCMQYVGGAWVSKEAKFYINGAWIDYSLYLYNQGQDYVDLTGEMTCAATQYNIHGYGVGIAPTITKSNDHFRLAMAKTSNAAPSGIMYFAKPIDFKNYNELHFNFYNMTPTSGNYYSTKYGYWPTIPTYYEEMTTCVTYRRDRFIGNGQYDTSYPDITLDVSGVTGSMYVVIALETGNRDYYNTTDISDIYLSTSNSTSSTTIYDDATEVSY